MKHLKSCAAAVLALLAADAALAQTTVRITGATAFRAATIASIQNLLAPGYDSAYNGTSSTGFTYGTFIGTGKTGTPVAGQSLVIQATWTGSVEGIRDVQGGLLQPFIKASFVPNTNGTGVTDTTQSVSTTVTDTNIYENAIPDITLADNAQSSTIYTANDLYEIPVGVIPFVFLKGRVAAGHASEAAFNSFTNITALQARSLLAGGIKLSLLTGAADAGNTTIYGLGRNNLSGTRVVTLAEIGAGGTSIVTQFLPTVTGDVTTGNITGMNIYPAAAATATTPAFDEGDNGYASGGTLADHLGRSVTGNAASNVYDGVPYGFIGYVGISDATRMAKNVFGTNTGNISNVLTYNGVQLATGYNSTTQAYTYDLDLIKQGKYTLWGYEVMGYRQAAGPNGTTALAGIAKDFADALGADIIATLPSSAGVKLSDMAVGRDVEGAIVNKL